MTIYQLFCGRIETANYRDHEGKVLHQMLSWPWHNLRKMGFDTVYLLGLFDHRGPIIVNQENGLQLNTTSLRTQSIFAIADHKLIDPGLGDLSQFNALIQTLHQNKLKVIVDLVVNQTSTNHPWISTHSDYYLLDNGQPKKEFSGDVYLLNNFHPDCQTYWESVIDWLLENQIDGVRCDMAHMTPLPLWQKLIQRAKERSSMFTFIAEVYSHSVFDWSPLTALQNVGFDLLYHEFLYRNLKAVLIQNQPLQFVTDHLKYVLQSPILTHLLHYVSNHDDPTLDKQGMTEALAALVWFLPGNRLCFQGSLLGFSRRLNHHTLDILDQRFVEIFNPPQFLINLEAIAQAFGRKTLQATPFEGQLILMQTSGNNGQKINLAINLSQESVPLTKVYPYPGLLHQLTDQNVLGPGLAEVWPQPTNLSE